MRPVVLVRLKSYINVVTPPLGIGYLLKVLKTIDGIEPIFVDCHLDRMENETLLDRLQTLDPMLVGFQVFSTNYLDFCSLVPAVKRVCPHTITVAGGPHISGLPEHTLREIPSLDYAVQSEGEEALYELVTGLLNGVLDRTIHTIPNLVYRKHGSIVANPVRLIDVGRYGAPDWELLQPDRYPPTQHGTFHKSSKVVPLLTSRGCPYPCSYCAGHLITGKKVRTRDVGEVADEIEFLQSRYGFEEFIIEDENFTYYKERVLAFARELKRRRIRCYFSFPNGVRPDRLDEEVIQALKAMGTYIVGLGIESGSSATLKRVHKSWNLHDLQHTINLIKQHNMIVYGFFIFGFPGETREDFEQTIQFALRSGLDMAYFGNYIPLPGSEDFNELIQRGELNLHEIDWNSYTSNYGRIPYCPKGITEEQLVSVLRGATLRFYLRPMVLYHFMKRMLRPRLIKNLLFRVYLLFRHPSSDQ